MPKASIIAIVIVSIGLTSSCGRHGKPAPVGGSDIPPSQVRLKRNVELAKAERRSIQYYVDTVGYLEAEGQARIAAGVSGVVDQVLFREGQWADANTVLITIDQKRYTTAADVARANEKRAEENVALKRDVANRFRAGAFGSSEAEKAQSALEVRVALADLEAAQANRALAEHNLQRSRVRPPYAGQINQRLVSPGDFVEDKTIIASMADVSRLRLVGSIPEKAAPTAREMLTEQNQRRAGHLLGGWLAGAWPGLATSVLGRHGILPSSFPVEFTLQPFPNNKFRGRIFFLSTVASTDTHQFEFKAEVNRHDSNVELKPGYTATIRVPLQSNTGACVIPEESVRASERGFIAFVPAARTTKDGQTEWVARSRTLDLGYRAPGWVEVLKGIEVGEYIVRKGAEALEDGTPINVPDSENLKSKI